jgi:class 3 adenylate cyclase
LELLLHQVATIYFMGWTSGAYFWLIYLAGLSFFNSQWSLKIQLALLFIVIATYLGLYLFYQEGVYLPEPNLQSSFALINGVTVLFVLSLLIYYFSTSAFKAETKLKAEQALTAAMLTKIEGLFGQQVSKEIAAEMISSEEEIKSKLYSATIMFLDIRDFTLFADSKPPSEVAHFQNIVFGALIEIVGNYKGVVLQLLGDGLMAVFGAPATSHNHAQNAVNASFDMMKKIEELTQQGQIPKIRVGIGLNSGDIVAGNLGNNVRKFYSLTGKNVIIAARIEPLNKKFNSQFLISESVLNDIQKDDIEVEDMGELALKGIEFPVRVYKLK